MPTAALDQIHLDPPEPVPFASDGMIIDALTTDVIAALFSIVGPDAETPLLSVELRHLGGAVGRREPNGGSVDHLPGEFLLGAVGVAPTPDVSRIVAEHAAAVRNALMPWASERDYRNFRDTPAPASASTHPMCWIGCGRFAPSMTRRVSSAPSMNSAARRPRASRGMGVARAENGRSTGRQGWPVTVAQTAQRDVGDSE